MDELLQHPKLIIEVMFAYWAFSALVSGMPDPPTGSFWYRWAYATLHTFAGNLKQFADSRISTLETNVKKMPEGTETSVKQTITEPVKKDGE